MCTRLASLAVLVLFTLAMSPAHAAASGATVRYPSGKEEVSGFLVTPARAGKSPAVIVIHEWWGLNDFARDKARHIAEQGYVALAVDLYRGQVATDPDTAHQLMRGMPEDRAVRDLQAAFTYLQGRKDVDPARIGVVGWCMGGGYSLALAVVEPKLRAAVIYYGRLITDEKQIARIKAPLLGNFGALDKGIPADSVEQFAATAKKLGVQVDFKVYPGAGHAFASSKDASVFKPDAARDADQRTDAFLAQHLKGK